MYLRQAKAVSIEGHPSAAYNGLYTHDSTHEGWPVLKNARGKYCYRHAARNQWMLTDKAHLHTSSCGAYIDAKEGPLPIGAHIWRVPDDAWPGVSEHSCWKDRKLSLGLLVRPPLPSPAPCAPPPSVPLPSQ